MQDVNVLVVFYSRTGDTERLALAAAVGAVQGRANIRLRRLPDLADEALIASVPAWKRNRDRMAMEYVAPRDADAEWADAILMGAPASDGLTSPEFDRYFESLRGKTAGKIGASFIPGFGNIGFEALGLIAVPASEEADLAKVARMQGSKVADAARAIRGAKSAGNED